MKAAELFVKALENEGVEYVFGIPGEENLDFLEALRTSKIKLVLTRHEQGAGFMAANYARVTGKLGVCLSTLGPGATNFTTPAAYALLGGMSVLFITGQKPIRKSKQGKFQIVDIVSMMEPLTKFAKQITHANNIPALVRQAAKLALSEKRGPVHLELPEDIAAEEIEKELYPVLPIIYPKPSVEAIDKAVEMIKAAKRPMLMIGAGANRCDMGKSLLDFVEKTGISFFTTQMGKGVIDEAHELCLGTAALSRSDYVHCATDRADLIINLGYDAQEKPSYFMQEDGAKVIHVNFYASEVDEVYFPQLDVLGDIKRSVELLTQKLEKQAHWDFDYFARLGKSIKEKMKDFANDERFPFLPQFVVHELRLKLGCGDVISLDNGMYKLWFARNYPSCAPNTMLLDNALATMGAGLPGAIGVKLAKPNVNVLAVCGDGGFMMNSAELETAVRLGLDITVIVLNDSGLEMIKWKQLDMKFDNFGLDFNNPDFVKYAQSYGAQGFAPKSANEFRAVLDLCLSTKGVKLIDLAIDYSLNHELLHLELANKSCEL